MRAAFSFVFLIAGFFPTAFAEDSSGTSDTATQGVLNVQKAVPTTAQPFDFPSRRKADKELVKKQKLETKISLKDIRKKQEGAFKRVDLDGTVIELAAAYSMNGRFILAIRNPGKAWELIDTSAPGAPTSFTTPTGPVIMDRAGNEFSFIKQKDQGEDKTVKVDSRELETLLYKQAESLPIGTAHFVVIELPEYGGEPARLVLLGRASGEDAGYRAMAFGDEDLRSGRMLIPADTNIPFFLDISWGKLRLYSCVACK